MKTPFEMQKDEEIKRKPAIHPVLILAIIVLVCAVLSYIIPAGNYVRYEDAEIGAELIEPGSFVHVARTPNSPMDFLQSLTKGLQNAGYVVFFLFIVGGMFAILNGTGALNVGIANILRILKGKELLIIPFLMIFFGCGSAFLGNFEEFLVFVPLILAICMTAGFDSLTAVGIIFMAAAAGYGGAITNAFTVGIAQNISGLTLFSGMGLRIVLFVCLEAASILYVMWFARAVKKNPKFSTVYAYDVEFNKGKRLDIENIPKLTTRQILVLIVFIVGIAASVWGVITQGWYIDELSGIFLAIGIIGGIVGGSRPGEICENFIKGLKDMVLPCVMIGLANAAIVLLQEANILDTILHALETVLAKLPAKLIPVGMFAFHEIFNVVVPSGSAQATITMPLMVPLADKYEITRQTAVLAFQLGDAFTNVLAPTGGEILAALAICRVPFGKWVKYLLPLFLIWCVIAIAFIVFALTTGYGPM